MLVALHDTPEALTVRPWPDSVLDRVGHDPRSSYVERFWLGRLPMPEVMLRVLLDPAALRVLRSPIAETIESIRIEPGRLIIQAGS